MRSFFEWYELADSPGNPWLILGKGPSFERRRQYELAGYRLLGLNHVVREEPVLLAHVIDADVVDACGDALVRNAGFVAMPWYPHQDQQPGPRTLAELAAASPTLRRLDAEGRLLWYDLSTAPVRHGAAPVIEATYFSAEAALNLLALAGARVIRTLGVDGGAAYSRDFDDLRDKTLLANGRPSFDLQFEGFARTIVRTGITFGPLDMPCPARVYVPCTAADAVPFAVLRHSLRRHASLSVEVTAIPVEGPLPGGPDARLLLAPGTQCLADVRPMWAGEIAATEVVVPGAALRLALIGPCAAAVDALVPRVHDGAAPPAAVAGQLRYGLPARWYPSERFHRDLTSFLWYGSGGGEPWTSRSHPLGHVWCQELMDAVNQGLIPAELVRREVDRGHVRASLAYQLDHGVVEPLLLPRRARLLDGRVPAAGGREGRSSWRSGSLLLVRAFGRQVERHARRFRDRQRSRRAPDRAALDPVPQGSPAATPIQQPAPR